MRRPQQVSTYSEEILHRAVDRREALQLSSEDDLFGNGHPPDSVVALALAYQAFKSGRQPGDYGITI